MSTDLAEPVRSIRVATTLVDRFRVLLASPIDDDSDVMTAEVQRIYPEIWRHLDDAARALRSRDRDVSQYDAIRRQELGALGITDVDVTTHIDLVGLAFGRIRIQQVKTVTFNLGGYNRANSGCHALMAILPEVDWDALSRAEDKEIAAAGSMHAATPKRALTFAVIALAVIGVSALLFHLLTVADVEEPPATRAPDKKEIAQLAERNKLARRELEIEELQRRYEKTCDKAVRSRLVYVLRENGQSSTANRFETETCVPARITCSAETKSALAMRIAGRPGQGTATLDVTCRGVSIAGPNGIFTPGYFVLAGALRGVFGEDGETEVVPVTPSPGARYVGAGDLDGDGSDEIVLVGATLFVVSRVVDGAFVDIAGPPLADGCAADVVMADTPDKKQRRVVIVAHSVGKRCLPPGRHPYKLVDGQLVKDE